MTTPPCPLCRTTARIATDIDHDPVLVECPTCGLGWFDPLPDESLLREHYADVRALHQPDAAHDFDADPAHDDAQAAALLHRLEELGGPPVTSVLDLGSGFPTLAAALTRRGLHVVAVEPNEQACAWGRDHGVTMASSVDEVEGRFDVVHASHVIEHLRLPGAVLGTVRMLLADDGALVGALPNWASLSARRWRGGWRWFAYPDHPWYFTPLSITLLLERTGFDVGQLETDLPLDDPISGVGGIAASRRGIERALAGQQLRFLARKSS